MREEAVNIDVCQVSRMHEALSRLRFVMFTQNKRK